MVDHVALDLFVRTTYQDAQVARRQIKKGKAKGRRYVVQFRAWEQSLLDQLGRSIHRKTHVYFLPLLVGLGVLLGGFKAFEKTSEFNQLWVETGGRLESELGYSQLALGEAESVNHLLLTQTIKSTSLEMHPPQMLHKNALLTHLKLLKAASHVSVKLFDVLWSLKDICVSPSPPEFEVNYIDTIFESMMPCGIITPLDCFWEGSKLLGPEVPLHIPGLGNSVRWTNLHPQGLVKHIKHTGGYSNFPFDRLDAYMKRSGINSGYQDKLCLDPDDPECPPSSPSKSQNKTIDLGMELANGCRGYATKYMNWPKELMLGNISSNKTGYIQNVDALQSVIQLMGERELYEYWTQSYKTVHLTSWDQEKASTVLRTWQKKFNEEIKRVLKNDPSTRSTYNFYTFSTMLLNDLLNQYDFLNLKLIYIGCILMAIFIGIVQINIFDAVRSQLVIGVFSLLLILLSIISGIGFCSIIGIQFHTATIAVVITIALAVGVNNMFLLIFSYNRVSSQGFDRTIQKYSGHMGKKQVGMVLKSSGTNILMTSIIIVAVFLTSAIVPIPALRAFCLQVAILVIFVMVTVLLGVTSLISFDLRRRRSERIDIFCCFPSKTKQWPYITKNKNNNNNDIDYNNDYLGSASTIDDQMRQYSRKSDSPIPPSANLLLKECYDIGSDSEDIPVATIKSRFLNWKSIDFTQLYINCLTTGIGQIYIILICIVILCISVWGIMMIEAGLTLPEMVPDGTNEQKFLDTYGQMFGFYNMYAVTKGDFEYPTNQRLLHDYHDAFMRVPNILKNDNGGLPQMWLKLFREWLLGLQKAFDRDWTRECINQEGWLPCATESGILGYKLLVQTGISDNPIDKSLVFHARLVDDYGIINEETFYNLLTAWASNDILAYGASQANIRPEPRHWTHVSNDYDLQIVKSSPIIYVQMPFYVNNLYDTSVITKFISIVRDICKQFDERGLPNYPSGIPFVYWEQYQDLIQYLYGVMGISFLIVFIFGALFLLNFRAAFITLLMSVILIIQMLGFMGFAGIKLSAISVVLLIGTVGTGATFSIHLILSFVTSIGDKQRRTHLSVDHMYKMVLQSGAILVIAVIMLVFQNNYVSKTYFYILIANTGFGLFNGLVCLPVFLSIFGPSPELKPLKYADRISTPSPEPIKKRSRYTSIRQIPPPNSNRKSNHHKKIKRHHKKQHGRSSKKRRHRVHYIPRNGSLSTITEESGSGSFSSKMEKIGLPRSLSRSLSSSSSISLSLSDCSTSTDSEFEMEMDTPQRTQSLPAGPPQTPTPTRCVLTAKFELELDNNAVQPCVHKSSSKIYHNNRQPKRHKHHHNDRY